MLFTKFIFSALELKLGHLFGKTAISKSENGISVGKSKSFPGHKGQYSFGGNEVLFFLSDEYVTHSCLAGFQRM